MLLTSQGLQLLNAIGKLVVFRFLLEKRDLKYQQNEVAPGTYLAQNSLESNVKMSKIENLMDRIISDGQRINIDPMMIY